MRSRNTHTHTPQKLAQKKAKKQQLWQSLVFILTGKRRRRRHLVYVQGHEMWLTIGEFETLSELVRARIETSTGIVPLSRTIVCRIRHEIDLACSRPGVRVNLIETGNGEEFSLSCAVSEIGRTPCFRDLVGKGFLNDETIKTILHAIGEVKQI